MDRLDLSVIPLFCGKNSYKTRLRYNKLMIYVPDTYKVFAEQRLVTYVKLMIYIPANFEKQNGYYWVPKPN